MQGRWHHAAMATPDLDRFLTYRLHRIAKLSDRASAAAYQAECGLTLSEGRCLAAVGQFEPASVKDLARLANLDKANASRAADALVARGLVAKAASATDGRGVALSLTREGRVLWRRTMKLIERRNHEVFGCLSAAELQALDNMLDRLVAHAGDAGPA
jgi:DNA-binding MarR family transcriptional regulator